MKICMASNRRIKCVRIIKRVTASPSFFLEYLNEDEKKLYHRLSQMLGEDDTSTIIDLPGKKDTLCPALQFQ